MTDRARGQRGGKVSISFTARTFLSDLSYQSSKHALYDILDEMGALYGRVKRSLLRDSIASRKKPSTFKNEYLSRYGITARQFNAIRYDLEGNIGSATEVLKLQLSGLNDKIKSIKKWVRRKEAAVKTVAASTGKSPAEKTADLRSLGFRLQSSILPVRAVSDHTMNGFWPGGSHGAIRSFASAPKMKTPGIRPVHWRPTDPSGCGYHHAWQTNTAVLS